MKTRFKTTLLLLLPFLTIICLFSGFIYFSISDYSHDDFFNLLRIRAITAAKAELDLTSESVIKESQDDFFERLPHERDHFFPILPEKTFEQEAEFLNVPLTFLDEVLRDGDAEYTNKNYFYKGIKYDSAQGEYIVIASAENYFELHHATYLKRILFFAIIASLIFSLIISFYFSKYVFRPITKITERVKQISSEHLNLRLDLESNNDEVNELSRTFNNMLDRIETSFETQNNFISNASHELRTPLTAIIGEADVTLSKIRSPLEYIETIKIVLDEAEKLDQKTKALLFLAQTGFNGKNQKFEEVRIDQLLWDVKETIEKINSKNKIHADTSLLPDNPAKLKVRGNDQLLHLALTNIINNACKYSDYRVVDVSIGASDDNVFIVVRDKGIGIPEEELKYIYHPFFRASNTKNYEGYGIGMPLTQNIIRMHKGEIIVSSLLNSGTTVEIKLPIGKF
ncbi:sensor histidine kinase [Catalinimonas niigatensis]|uniref:sensor histidine kinase n=1 Tax=Catalinimonas niigatensis TaxID=1397264 RepID=UPI002666B851|nr:HAMP domain-containing sensor histidine kinase [Catalinimonas niigatensis]WPP50518.1 HAMP domain-containing sensor histidine kinase [Catalinimonas niigatensis]